MTQLFGQPTKSSPTHPSSTSSPISITYEAKPGLGGISFKNFFLGLITLTIYRFWAKTNVRKHVWSCIHINGEPLEYTGTGKELFIGAVIIFFIILLPFILIVNGLNFAGYPIAAAIAQIGFTLLFLVLIGMAIYRARRYRLSRTLWRGIRGTLVGSSFKYSLLFFGTLLLSGVTAGWSNPAMNLELQERITKDMRFGETPFGFKGSAGALYGRYAMAWFASLVAMILVIGGLGFSFSGEIKALVENVNDLENDPKAMFKLIGLIYGSLFVVGIVFATIWSFYTAFEMTKYASYTYFENATFQFNATGLSLIWLMLGNLLIIVFSLGIASPFAAQRTIRYFVDRLEIQGTVDIGKIQQSSARMDTHGEGLLDALDIDGI